MKMDRRSIKRFIAMTLCMTMMVTGFNYGTFADPVEHVHTYGDWLSDGEGKHTHACTEPECTASETEDCDTAGENGACSKCGYIAGEIPSEHIHQYSYSSVCDNRHIFICECGEVQIEDCDLSGGPCSICKNKMARVPKSSRQHRS